jgi:hypothetical protein
MTLKFPIQGFLFGSLLFFLGACSNPMGDSSNVDPNYGGTEGVVVPASTGFEPISGSKLSMTSVSATHKVDATVGVSTSEIKLTTTKNKIVYLSVQGQMISK